MPYIKSAGPSTIASEPGTTRHGYTHGVDVRRQFIPMAFQITSPLNNRIVLMPHALVMHVNPQSFGENFNKKVERIQTRGGFVEQHWGDELGDISADGSTGAFINIYTGTSSVLRHRTIAWDRFRDLHDIYKNNGSLHDPYGNIVLQGNVMLLYDRGTYLGYFKTFAFEETDDSPFAFKMSWSFKVEETILKIPAGEGPLRRPVAFQSQNQEQADPSDLPGGRMLASFDAEAQRLAAAEAEANEKLAASAKKKAGGTGVG